MDSEIAPIDVLERIRQLETELAASWRIVAGRDPERRPARLLAVEVVAGQTRCLLPVGGIREVVAMVWPQPLPDAPHWVLGTTMYGIQAVPLVDLGSRLNGVPTPISARLTVIILDQPRWLGLVVEEVGRVLELDTGQLSSPGPEIPYASFLVGTVPDHEGRSTHLLSASRLGRELDDHAG
jgi:chemotaxis signal transduction protein